MAPHTHPAIIQSLVSVSGVLTEVLSIATSVPAALQVLIIPGNPGNAGYYRGFMQHLYKAFHGRAHIVACSHAGHELGPHNQAQQLFDVHEQIQHKVDFMKEHLLLPGRPPLIVLAHSIGSFMAVHAIREVEKTHAAHHHHHHHHRQHHRPHHTHSHHHHTIKVHTGPSTPLLDTCTITIRPQHTGVLIPTSATITENAGQAQYQGWWPLLHVAGRSQQQDVQLVDDMKWLRAQPNPTPPPPILKVVAMMPFFQADFKQQLPQRLLRFVARRYALMSMVAHVISLMPMVVRMALVNWWTKGRMSSDAVRTTCELLHRHTIHNNFFLANHEFELLDTEFDWGLLRDLGSRLHVVACPGDVWMSEAQFNNMMQAVPGLQASWHTDLQHAFCVSTDQCQVVTDVVKAIAQDLVADSGAHLAAATANEPVQLSSKL